MLGNFTRMVLLAFVFVWQSQAWAESNAETPQYHIQVPTGGLTEFFKWHTGRIPLVSHHRGGPVPGYPENAIETMQYALSFGPGLMEVDVAQLADGTLVLMHDNSLDRTTTGTGRVATAEWPYVKTLKLKDETGDVIDFGVPTLKETLLWAKGKVILTLDIKRGTSFTKVAALVRDTGTEDYVMGISYNLKQAEAFHKIAPFMPLSITVKSEADIQAIKGSTIPTSHVVAWTGTSELPASLYDQIHTEGWRVIMGTLGPKSRSLDHKFERAGDNSAYLRLYQKGVDIIATDRYQAVQNIILAPNLLYFVRGRAQQDVK